MVSWKTLIEDELALSDLTWVDIVCCTLDDAALNKEFDAGPGKDNGQPFLAWTKGLVIFPVGDRGGESAASAPRHPRPTGQFHVGG